MQKLNTYLKTMPLPERIAFAERCGTTYPHLRNVSYGLRVASEKLCVAIHRESQGAVTRQDLRPHDWLEIWPELAETNW